MRRGGKINKNFLKKHLKVNKYDIIIAVDKGLERLDELKTQPHYIVGDFDSINNIVLDKYKDSGIQIKRLIPEKDFTDTESALDLAIKKQSHNITIIGAIGTRLDHTIANVHILKKVLERNIEAKIINERNEIKLIDKTIEIEYDDRYKYISLIPLTTQVKGVTLRGFKYEIENYTLQIGESLGVSNEQIAEKATIDLKDGILILIKSRD